MIVELRDKAQLTIPKEIVRSMSLAKGDKFEIVEKNGEIHIIPVVIYPKEIVDELKTEVKETRAKYEAGDAKAYDKLEELFACLDKDNEL